MIANLYSRLYGAVDGRTIKCFSSLRRSFLEKQDFSIISNNCWAGSVYKYFGLPYLSPTVGLYFYPDDYNKLCYNLREYMAEEVKYLKFEESKHKEKLAKKGQTNVPLGLLGDIEIIFLHYPTFEEAADKWNRRAKRINWDNVFIKNSEMNGTTEEELRVFDRLPFKNKFVFVSHRYPEIKSSVYFPGYEEGGQVTNDTHFFHRYINVIKWLNSSHETYPMSGFKQ